MIAKRAIALLAAVAGVWAASQLGVVAALSVYMLIYMCGWLLVYKRQSEYPEYAQAKPLTVVIPCYNDAEGLRRSLRSMIGQNYKHHFTVIVVNDGSTDHTAQVMAEYAGDSLPVAGGGTVTINCYHHEKNSGLKSVAVTTGLSKADLSDGFVMIIDADTELDRMAVENSMRYMLANPELSAACGSVLPIEDGSLIKAIQCGEHSAAYGTIKAAEALHGMVMVSSGACSIHTVQALQEVGGFEGWVVEDICWTWKARAMGKKVGYVQLAFAFTQVPNSVKWLVSQRRRWGRGRIEAAKAAASVSGSKFHQFAPALFMAIGEVLSPVLWVIYALINPIAAAVLWLSMFSISAVYSSEYARAIRRVRPVSRWQPLINTLCTGVLNLLVFTGTLSGFLDELRGKQKTWLTNELKGK